ncbi:MAG: hypothetical protein ABSD71_00535 [Bacteroidales bacterium]|jgi:hypothetical protein
MIIRFENHFLLMGGTSMNSLLNKENEGLMITYNNPGGERIVME